jgi:hypothetical protein
VLEGRALNRQCALFDWVVYWHQLGLLLIVSYIFLLMLCLDPSMTLCLGRLLIHRLGSSAFRQHWLVYRVFSAAGQAGWDLARSLLRPRDGLWCPRPTAAAALNHRFLTRTLRWATEAPPLAEKPGSGSKSGKQKSSSKSGKKLQPALAPALSAAGARSNKEVDAVSGVGGYSLPFVSHHREGPRLADAGAKFDRKVKLKVRKEAAAGPQSAIAWTAFFPLSRPSRPQDAPPEKSSADPLIGLKRLVGLDAGALPTPPTPPPKADSPVDFPHVAALAQLLGQTFLHQQVPVGLQPVGRAQGKAEKKGSAGKAKAGGRLTDLADSVRAPTAGLARDALPVAAASVAAVASLGTVRAALLAPL